MFPQAERLLDVWASEYPHDYRPHLRRAKIYAGSKQWSLAIRELREAQKRAPREIAVLRDLGNCLYKNDEIEEAEQVLQAVILQDQADTASRMILAQIAFDRSDHKQALVLLEQVCRGFSRSIFRRDCCWRKCTLPWETLHDRSRSRRRSSKNGQRI